MAANLLKSALHNVASSLWGSVSRTWAGRWIRFSASRRSPSLSRRQGAAPPRLRFLVRLWATFHFYVHKMRVISLEAQTTLITSGPFRFSRNPLYLGGNVFIFFGAALLLGSPTALVVTALHIPLMDRFIRREEEQLERRFGDEWRSYKRRVRRWL
jgi:protein-S-isoprenylcysteine O-methyltransferase Ste14